jgi:hypothetical protein
MKYRKKTVVIDAELYKLGMEDGVQLSDGSFHAYEDKEYPLIFCLCMPAIKTLEGWHIISEGDYIITGIKGERYPCKPDIFEMTYELVEE